MRPGHPGEGVAARQILQDIGNCTSGPEHRPQEPGPLPSLHWIPSGLCSQGPQPRQGLRGCSLPPAAGPVTAQQTKQLLLGWGAALGLLSCQESVLHPGPELLPDGLLIMGTFLITAFTVLIQLSVGPFLTYLSNLHLWSLPALLSGGVDGCLASHWALELGWGWRPSVPDTS